jgi:hypothetical protein
MPGKTEESGHDAIEGVGIGGSGLRRIGTAMKGPGLQEMGVPSVPSRKMDWKRRTFPDPSFSIPLLYLPPRQSLTMDDPEIKEMLKDLLWLNAVIATELIQITENTSESARKSPPPERCLTEHNELRRTALAIAERYREGTMLSQHILKHQ